MARAEKHLDKMRRNPRDWRIERLQAIAEAYGVAWVHEGGSHMRQEKIDPRAYPLQVRPLSEDEGGGYLASVPDLPGCMGDGETEAAAIADVRSAIASWIETAEKFGDPVPEPNCAEAYSGKFVTRIPKSLHMTLAAMARREGVSLNQFILAKLAEAAGGNQARP